jgi:hypothetical protein
VAGFSILTTSSQIHGFSYHMLWYLNIWEIVSQSFPLYSIRVKTEWGTQTMSSCPKVSLSASATMMAVTARVCRQGG